MPNNEQPVVDPLTIEVKQFLPYKFEIERIDARPSGLVAVLTALAPSQSHRATCIPKRMQNAYNDPRPIITTVTITLYQNIETRGWRRSP